MTTRTYKFGKFNCKAYKKPCGKGFEVGFTFAGDQIFVGNFIHSKEATAWWTLMNNEVRKCHRKFMAAPLAPRTWTSKFLANCFYKAYYSYLDREFSKYHRGFTQAVKQDERKLLHFKKTWAYHKTHMAHRKAA